MGGSHTALNNILLQNGTPLEEHGPKSTLEGNVTEKVTADIVPETAVLTWSAAEPLPQGKRLDVITHDFFEQLRTGATAMPGPFVKVPSASERVNLWPAAAEETRK